MEDWSLKYGLNPHQGDAFAAFPDGHHWIEVLNGVVGYINVLDALRAWSLARELAGTLAKPSAASIKHVHPAGAAVAASLDRSFRESNRIDFDDLSPIATAYARARAGDRIASFGDFIGLSEPVDPTCARLIAKEVSDGIIAPDFEPAALSILKQKKQGKYLVLRADPSYHWTGPDVRREEGIELRQRPSPIAISPDLLRGRAVGSRELPDDAVNDLLLATVVVRHTPSNAVCIAYDGQAVGIGGGQQARIYATRSACEKADLWRLQLHPRALLISNRGSNRPVAFNIVRQWLLWDELSGREQSELKATAGDVPAPLSKDERDRWLASHPVVMSSDGYIPFADNVERAARSAVRVIAQPGGRSRTRWSPRRQTRTVSRWFTRV